MIVLVAALNTVIVGGCCVLLAKRRDDRGERLQWQDRNQQYEHEFFQRSEHGRVF